MATVLSLILAFMLSIGVSPASSVNPAGCPGDTIIQVPVDNNCTIKRFVGDYNQKTTSRANLKKIPEIPLIKQPETKIRLRFTLYLREELHLVGYMDSFKLYEAFNNNPLNYVDPYGMSSKKHGINPLVSRSAYSKLFKYYRSKGMSGDAASNQALSDLVKYGYIEDKSELKLGIAVTAGTGFFFNSMHYVTLPLFELSPAGIFKDAVSLPFGKDLVYGTKLKWWNYAMVGVPILYETFKIGRGLGLADEFLDIGDYVSKRGSSIWGLGPGPRGEAIEKMLGQNLPKNYPTIDRFDNGVVTSIKSMDLTLKSPMNPKYLLRTAKKYIDQVKNFKGARWARAEISANEISRRGLNLAIPRGIATSQQKAVLNQIIRYGKENNILVKIIEVD
jgi:hypothetical protein